VGGGAVYLDAGQLFTQWVFHAGHLPEDLEARFELYVRPLVETYQALGIPAYLRPINDVHVGGKKIGGTGAAQMGDAEVVVGSLMFTFDKATMAHVLKVPTEKMRDKVYQSLEQYMTTMQEQLAALPDRAAVKRLYVERCAAALGAEIVPGKLTAAKRRPWRRSTPASSRMSGCMREVSCPSVSYPAKTNRRQIPRGCARGRGGIQGARRSDPRNGPAGLRGRG